MRKRVSLRLSVFVTMCVIFIGFFNQGAAYAASEEPTVNVTVHATQAGTPIGGIRLRAENFEIATQKIMTGRFRSQDLSSSYFYQLMNDYTTSSGSIVISQSLLLGPGHVNTPSDTQKIIQTLFNDGFETFLRAINEDDMQNPQIIPFHTPGVNGRFLTDSNGIAEARVRLGMTAILDDSNKTVKLVEISEKTSEIKVDTVNLDSRMVVSITGVLVGQIQGDGASIVEYGQKVSYTVTIDKAFLQNGETDVVIDPNPNIVIDSISRDFTSESNVSRNFSPEDFLSDPTVIDTSPNKLLTSLRAWFSTRSLNTYTVSVPQSDTSVTFSIVGHLAPIVSVPDCAIQLATGGTQRVSLEFSDLASSSDNGISSANTDKVINIHAVNMKTGETLSYQTPGLRTGGINYVVTDASKARLLKGAQYSLIKTIGQDHYVYSSDGWERLEDGLDSLPDNAVQLVGGNLYAISADSAIPIDLNTDVWNFSAEAQQKTNQALLQIRGLAPGARYALYQTVAPKDYPIDRSPQEFTISVDSIGSASDPSYALNGEIATYDAGVNEYNVLPVGNDTEHLMNPSTRVVAALAATACCVLLIGAVLIVIAMRRGKAR